MSPDGRELGGRVALVTGAGRNIGRAIALALADAGATVLVNARSNEAEAGAVVREIESRGGRAIALLADVVDREAVTRMVASAEQFGRLDILVNNAALRRETPLDQMTFAEWREITGVILDGAFNCVTAALPWLRRSDAGTVVNIGGVSGHAGAKDRLHVVTAKAGLAGFTRALARDLGGDGITVNCVAPGFIDTPRAGTEPQHHRTLRTVGGRRGTPDDIAAMVRFLCGPAARHITGQTIHVNGGAFPG
jgi:3-oxoacyl-[acyl-carrier protein] reductase